MSIANGVIFGMFFTLFSLRSYRLYGLNTMLLFWLGIMSGFVFMQRFAPHGN